MLYMSGSSESTSGLDNRHLYEDLIQFGDISWTHLTISLIYCMLFSVLFPPLRCLITADTPVCLPSTGSYLGKTPSSLHFHYSTTS